MSLVISAAFVIIVIVKFVVWLFGTQIIKAWLKKDSGNNVAYWLVEFFWTLITIMIPLTVSFN